MMSLAALPEAGGIVWGASSGPTVTVFSDFRCGYCRALSGVLESMNVRVIERPISVLGSRDLANQVFCARDRRKAVKAAYAGAPITDTRACDTSPLDANERLRPRAGSCRNPGDRPLGRRGDRRLPPARGARAVAEGRQVVTALTPKQQAGLVRAVARRSRGQVSLPVRAEPGRSDPLWQDLVAATAAPQGGCSRPANSALLPQAPGRARRAMRAWGGSAVARIGPRLLAACDALGDAG
jgi:hypothetical protein